jgi:hypothetical protein
MRSCVRLLPLLSAILLAAAPAAAQSLHGRVVDAATGAPVADARVSLLEPGGALVESVRSDPSGAFRLAAAVSGTYRVTADRLGYRVTLTREIELPPGVRLEVELRMSPAALVLDTAVARATARRGVHGVVLDDSTGLPVAGAAVTLKNQNGHDEARARTDERGAFSITLRRAGGVWVESSAAGYLPSESRALTLAPDDTVQLELRLSRQRVLLAPVRVVAASRQLLRDAQLAGFEWRRRSAVRGRFMGPEEIRRLNAFNATDVLQAVPFVRVTGGYRKSVTVRGMFGSRCIPTFYVDGHPTVAGAEISLDEVVSGTVVAAVEVYTRPSAAPPEFQPRGLAQDCGVVVIWTRPPGQPR